MTKYNEQAADKVAAAWRDYADDPIVREIGDVMAGMPGTVEVIARRQEADLARREAGLAKVVTPRTEVLPPRDGSQQITASDRVRGTANKHVRGQIDVIGKIGHSMTERRALGREAGQLERDARIDRQRAKQASAAQWRAKRK